MKLLWTLRVLLMPGPFLGWALLVTARTPCGCAFAFVFMVYATYELIDATVTRRAYAADECAQSLALTRHLAAESRRSRAIAAESKAEGVES